MSSSGSMAFYAIRRRQHRIQQENCEEEERMTPYEQDQLDNDWEFKIVRSNYPKFHKPEKLKMLIDREARAGWEMLEKFDDTRIRFKRHRSYRSQDVDLPPEVDPYRTYFGTSPNQINGIVIAVSLAMILIIFGATMLFFLLTLLFIV